MNRLARVYRAQYRTILAIQFQYRVSMAIWMIGLVLQPLIYLVVWTSVARGNGSHIGTFSTGDFAAYYIALMLVDHLTFTWIIFGNDMRVRQGALSPLLLRPIHPIHGDLVENLSYKLLMLTIMFPAAVVMCLVFRPTPHPAPWAVALFVPVLLLAIALRFLVEWTISLLAFWIIRMGAIDQMYYVVLLFFSGSVAPLALLPGPARILGNVLPFRWMISFPVELLVGRMSPADAVTGVGVLAFWIVLAATGLRFTWRRGIVRYGAVGA